MRFDLLIERDAALRVERDAHDDSEFYWRAEYDAFTPDYKDNFTFFTKVDW
ncbi:MAG: hypothetical protein AMXMBFR60_14420 [Chloroflexota bacterium]